MKSRKKLRNREKKIKIEKNISESSKKFQNREEYFRIEKNISESRKCFRIEKHFVKRIDKKPLTTFLHNSFIGCERVLRSHVLHKMWLSNWK